MKKIKKWIITNNMLISMWFLLFSMHIFTFTQGFSGATPTYEKQLFDSWLLMPVVTISMVIIYPLALLAQLFFIITKIDIFNLITINPYAWYVGIGIYLYSICYLTKRLTQTKF